MFVVFLKVGKVERAETLTGYLARERPGNIPS
jgi:hypothetical protein